MSRDNSFSREERLFDRADAMARFVPYAIAVAGTIALAGAVTISALIYKHYHNSSHGIVIKDNSGAEHPGGQR